jgi:hypothetical protein
MIVGVGEWEVIFYAASAHGAARFVPDDFRSIAEKELDQLLGTAQAGSCFAHPVTTSANLFGSAACMACAASGSETYSTLAPA